MQSVKITFIITALFLVLHTENSRAGETIVTVRKNDTISIIARKHYGIYSDDIGQIITRANGLSNIDLIYIGQKIILPEIESVKEEIKVQARVMVAALVEGTVRYRESVDDQWKVLAIDQTLTEGAEVETIGDGRAEFVLDNKSIIRLAPDSRILVASYKKDDTSEKTEVFLPFGKLWTKVAQLISPQSVFNVHLSTTIVGVQGTIFRIDVAKDGPADIRVFEGQVSMSLISTEGTADETIPPVIVREFKKVTVHGRTISQPMDIGIEDANDTLFAWGSKKEETVDEQEELSKKIKIMYELKKKAQEKLR